jgi:hypothetical protein
MRISKEERINREGTEAAEGAEKRRKSGFLRPKGLSYSSE